jgi:adenylosuccinate lyase
MAHSVIALKSLLKGLGKLVLNPEPIRHDLQKNWAIITEGIQTILRREGYPEPYEALKSLTRTHSRVDQKSITEFIEQLDVSPSVKDELKRLTPESYTGVYDF